MKNKIISTIVIAFSASSCYKLQPCTEYRKRFFDKEVQVVVKDKGPQGNSFHIKGIEPVRLIEVNYADVDGLYNFIWNSLEIGDTLIKHKGNDNFLLKKKSFNLLVKYNCDGGVTGIIKPDTLEK